MPMIKSYRDTHLTVQSPLQRYFLLLFFFVLSKTAGKAVWVPTFWRIYQLMPYFKGQVKINGNSTLMGTKTHSLKKNPIW